MQKKTLPLALAATRALLILLILCVTAGTAHAWRSALYPENWTPDFKGAEGRFLHDFSYAGYHKGEVPIPTNPLGETYDVTAAPYNTDNTGSSEDTRIQTNVKKDRMEMTFACLVYSL